MKELRRLKGNAEAEKNDGCSSVEPWWHNRELVIMNLYEVAAERMLEYGALDETHGEKVEISCMWKTYRKPYMQEEEEIRLRIRPYMGFVD